MLTAIQICVLTAVADVQKNALMCRFGLSHLKKSSICLRHLYYLAIVNASSVKLLGKKNSRLLVSVSL